MKQYEVKIDQRLITKLDEILPKLKYSVSYKRIIRWLKNFDQIDQNLALEFLFYLEYLDFNELTYRLNEKFEAVLETLSPETNLIIYPGAADYPKSPDLINYILKSTPVIEKLKKKKRVQFTRNLEELGIIQSPSVFVLVDDFIGSGGSFGKAYDTKTGIRGWIQLSPAIKEVYLVSVLAMNDGLIYIDNNYPEVWVFSDVRYKLFRKRFSPLKISKRLKDYKEVAINYGSKLVRRENVLGYKDSQSLIAFHHTAPNNTLPIIWSGKNWYPIYPRFGINKMEEAKNLKREVAYYIGIMNRLGLDLYEDKTIYVNGKRKLKYNSLEDHSIITLIKLKVDGFEMPSICQILGITEKEHDEIVSHGKKRNFFDYKGDLSSVGREFYHGLRQKIDTRKLRLIRRKKEDFIVKNIIYIPKQFKGTK